jgi:hypothetical protein
MITRIGALAGAAGVMLYGSMIGASVAIYDAGAVRVSVHEKSADGKSINLVLPAVVVPMGLGFVPEEELRKASREMQPWLPVILEASQALADSPDGVLVEVVSSEEHVNIAKRGGSLYVDVDDSDATVHVSFPVKTVAVVASKLATIEPDGEKAAERSHASSSAPGV